MPGYELSSTDLPVLGGRTLGLVARLLEGPLRGLLLPRLLRDGGLLQLREWRHEEPPTFYPLGASPASASASASAAAPGAVPLADRVTAHGLAEAYRSGRTTPSAIAEAHLAAVSRLDAGARPLRAFVAIAREDVLRQAAESTRRLAAGEARGPLEGVPIAIKDELDQTPYPTTVGTRFLGDRPAARDATVVARLRAAGAVLVGKAAMHEIGINPTGQNLHHGQTRNPHHLDRDPGGSSSGPAAAVAAGLVPIAIGADGGGSIRIPAALCGVTGLKASFGRVSEAGAAPLCWSVAHVGPIAGCVADLALAYATIAGPDPADPMSQRQPPVELARGADVAGLRLGIYPPWFEHARPELVAAARVAVAALVARGAVVHEIEIPELEEMRVAHVVAILSEMAAAMARHRDQRRQQPGIVRLNLAVGDALTAADYVAAQRMRTRAHAHFGRIFGAVDAIVTPATAITAPAIRAGGGRHGHSDLGTVTELMRYVVPGNFVGLPALAVPIGRDPDGLPIGLQLMAAHWREDLLLRLAAAVEADAPPVRAALAVDLLA